MRIISHTTKEIAALRDPPLQMAAARHELRRCIGSVVGSRVSVDQGAAVRTSLALKLGSELFGRDLRYARIVDLPCIACVAVVDH